MNTGQAWENVTVSLACDVDGNVANGFVPAGTEVNRFQGTFNGEKHTVTITHLDGAPIVYGGLFGWTGENARVMNTNVTEIVCGCCDAGSVAGINTGLVIGCKNYALISSLINVGGITGTNREAGVIAQCENYGENAGGAAAINMGADIVVLC